MLKKIGIGLALLIVAGGAIAYPTIDGYARIGAGYKAKLTCSEIFVAGRTSQSVLANEFRDINPALEKVSVNIDAELKTVSASLLGLGKSKAIYRDGYGCTLMTSASLTSLPELEQPETLPVPEAMPDHNSALARVDYDKIDRTLADAFKDDDAEHLAFLVLVDGKVVAEKYAQGFSAETPFLSWSMAKSITATLVGTAIHKGLVDLNETPPVPEWRDGDERNQISWADLLHMQDGLRFEENYADPGSDVIKMLYRAHDTGGVSANKELAEEPGQHWSYSSGTTNLIARSLRLVLEEKDTSLFDFANNTLLKPLGAGSIVMEPDSSGTIIGSSYIYATARDWAKFGQLYLQDGVWNGQRLLPEGWVEFVSTPSGKSDRFYGAHFWLNQKGRDGRAQFIPGLPEDVYVMAGHEGQYVVIIPDKNMIIVRTGRERKTEAMKVVAPSLAALYASVDSASQ